MKSQIAFSVDWIRGTYEFEPGFRPEFYLFEDDPNPRPCRALFSYTDAVETDFCTLCWNPDRPDMRVMLQMSGKQLARAREAGYQELYIVSWLWVNGLKFTRLDFAMDLLESGGDVLDFRDAWQTPALSTQARKMTAITSDGVLENKGNTVYLGSRQSTRMVRIYDKGKEQGTSLDWIRIEMEWKHDRAAQLARDMKDHGVSEAGKTHLRNFIPSSLIEWFEAGMDGDYTIFAIDSIGRPLTNHERWIFEVCIPAIMQAVENGVPGVMDAIEAIIKTNGDRSQHGPNIAPHPPKN
jgi:hypothetical protein